MRIVTGHTGSEHVTSDDQATYNAKTIKPDTCFLGDELVTPTLSGTTLTMKKADILLQGVHCRFDGNETFNVNTIPTSQWRKDLICVVYTKGSSGIESVDFSYKVGSVASSEAAAQLPSYDSNDIRGGASTTEEPIYLITVSGSNISVTSVIDVALSRDGLNAKINAINEALQAEDRSIKARLANLENIVKYGSTRRSGTAHFNAPSAVGISSTYTVTFGTPFSRTPKVFVSLKTNSVANTSLSVNEVTKNGFKIRLFRGGAEKVAMDVDWMATIDSALD